jgi:hypothetical protein
MEDAKAMRPREHASTQDFCRIRQLAFRQISNPQSDAQTNKSSHIITMDNQTETRGFHPITQSIVSLISSVILGSRTSRAWTEEINASRAPSSRQIGEVD